MGSIVNVPNPLTPVAPIDIEASSADEIIRSRFQDILDKSEDAISQAYEFLGRIESTLSQPASSTSSISYTKTAVALEDIYNRLKTLRPLVPAVDIGSVDTPSKPTYVDIPTVEDIVVPDLSAAEPTVVVPDAPNTPMPDDPGTPPNVGEVDLPARPFSYDDFPDRPNVDLDSLLSSIPPMPAWGMPSYEGEPPDLDLSPPELAFLWTESMYSSPLSQETGEKILAEIRAGGTGLGAAVEDAIWQRARDRVQDQFEQTYNLLVNAPIGFARPPGALRAALQTALAERDRGLAQLNYEIAIEQAKLALSNMHTMLDKAIAHEQSLMNYANAMQTRLFEAQKAVVELGIAVYNARISTFNAQLQKWQTAASVYAEQVKAVGLQFQAYGLQLEGVKTAASIQGMAVDIYAKELSGFGILADIYKADVQAAGFKLEVERTRLDAFKTQVEVFATRVAARTAEMNLWQARMAGEAEKVKLYGQQVQAYATRVEALKTRLSLSLGKVQAAATTNQALLGQYTGDIEAFKALLAQASRKTELETELYKAQAAFYGTDEKAMLDDNSVQLEKQKNSITDETSRVSVSLKLWELTVNETIERLKLTNELLKSGAAVSSQLVASIYSSLNLSAQLSHGTQHSKQAGYSWNQQISNAASLSEDWNSNVSGSY